MVALPTVRLWLMSLLATHALGAVHEMLTATPMGWVHQANAASNTSIVLSIGLQEQNLDQLESKLYAISTPGNALYQQHMEGTAVDALLAPKPESFEKVQSWLKSAGVTKMATQGSFINFATTVGTANKLLSTQFAHYGSDGVTKLRTTHYSIPDDLTAHVDLVTPTTFFGKTTAMAPPALHYSQASRDAAVAPFPKLNKTCADEITPQCIHELYNIDYTPDPKCGSRIAFGSFLNQSARHADLAIFEKNFTIPGQAFTNQIINGGVDDQSISENHGEANLDVQYIMAVAHPLPVSQYLTGGSPPFIPNLDEPIQNENEPYLSYYQYLLAQPNSALPQVISNSYGDDEQTVPVAYAKRVCNMIGQLGMRGISVLESSGDTGVGAACLSNDGKNTTTFTPQFPGTCPYITAVGGTQSISPEIAWTASSGGFSSYFPQPAYQRAAVTTYLTKYLPAARKKYFSSYTNFAGRGFPDVSAHSLTPWYAVVVNGAADISGGTSAAAPVFSATIALVNDALLRAGKKPLGFLNPFLYRYGASGLTDITAGASEGCNGVNGQTGLLIPGGGIIKGAFWNATVGWDPATGLGVPNFGKLKDIALLVCR